MVSVAEKTGENIRLAAFSAATIGTSPKVRARKSACSPTTMASSTTMPSVIIKANKDIIIIVMPDIYIRVTAAAIAAGIPAATQKAVLTFKNKNNKSKTSPSPCNPFFVNMESRAEINSERVRMSSTSTSGGKISSNSSATPSTSSWISIASP